MYDNFYNPFGSYFGVGTSPYYQSSGLPPGVTGGSGSASDPYNIQEVLVSGKQKVTVDSVINWITGLANAGANIIGATKGNPTTVGTGAGSDLVTDLKGGLKSMSEGFGLNSGTKFFLAALVAGGGLIYYYSKK